MLPIAAKIVAFTLPAVIGLIAGAIGARSVKQLRVKTGDDSVLTNVLSGEVFHSHRERETA